MKTCWIGLFILFNYSQFTHCEPVSLEYAEKAASNFHNQIIDNSLKSSVSLTLVNDEEFFQNPLLPGTKKSEIIQRLIHLFETKAQWDDLLYGSFLPEKSYICLLVHYCRVIGIKLPILINIVKEIGGEVLGFAAIVGFLFPSGADFIDKSHPNAGILSLIQFEK